MLVRKNDDYLRKIYQDKFDATFLSEKKVEGEVAKLLEWDYYPEFQRDTDTVKHIKKLSNGIIGIKKVLDDYVKYKQASVMQSMTYMATFLYDLKTSYTCFQEFDHQAIMAEQASPLAEFIKTQLKKVNGLLEQVACVADEIEGESGLKEGVLLKYLPGLIKRYNQITHELKIPTDYIAQKRVYLHARMKARQQYLQDIDAQLENIKEIIQYQDVPLAEIPENIIHSIQHFIAKYDDSICVDRDHLANYKKYLQEASLPRNEILRQLEYVANYFQWTIHSEVMKHFKDRLLYLLKQKTYLITRLKSSEHSLHENPYDHFAAAELSESDHHKVIMRALKNRIDQLQVEKEDIFKRSIEIKEEKSQELRRNPKETELTERMTNQLTSKVKENGIFAFAIWNYEHNDFNAYHSCIGMAKEEASLSPESLVLVHEIDEILKTHQNTAAPKLAVNS